MRAMCTLRTLGAMEWITSTIKPDRFEIVCLPGKRLVYLKQDDKWGLTRYPAWVWFEPTTPLVEVGVTQLMEMFVEGMTVDEVFAT